MEKFNFLVDFNENLIHRCRKNRSKPISFTNLLTFPNELKLSPTNLDALKDFITSLNDTLDIIGNIFDKPYVLTKTNEVIIRSELVSELGPDSFIKTTLDSSLWKQKRNHEFSPELVYSIEYEDTINNYENHFIIYVLNKIIDIVTNFKEFNLNYTNSLKSFYGTTEASLSKLSIYASINKNKEELSKYIFYSGANNENFEALSKIHSKIKHLKLHKFYRLLKDTSFSLPINLTNTILHDLRYNKVYRFFKDNLLFSETSSNFDDLFYNYTLVRLLNYLTNNKKVSELSIPLLKVNKAKLLRFNEDENISFKLNKFNYVLKLDLDHLGFILETTFNKVTTLTLIKVNYVYHDSDYLNNTDYISKFDNYLVITNNNMSKNFNNVSELNYEKELLNDLIFENILLSTEIILPLSRNTLIKCPYCGETNLVSNLNNYHCLHCNNEFLTLNINHKIHVWLKSLYRGN